jgi:Domain of unknown function (DUF4132)
LFGKIASALGFKSEKSSSRELESALTVMHRLTDPDYARQAAVERQRKYDAAPPVADLTTGHGACEQGQAIILEYREHQNNLCDLPGKPLFDKLMAQLCGKRYWELHDYRDVKKYEDLDEPSKRLLVFDVLDRLYAIHAVQMPTDKDTYGNVTSASSFAMTCFRILQLLLREGFPVDMSRTFRALDFLVLSANQLNLVGWKTRDYSNFKIGILAEIHRAWRNGIVLPEEARVRGRELIRILESDPHNKTFCKPEKDDPACLRALKEFSGTAQQQSYFQRMKAAEAALPEHKFETWFSEEGMATWIEVINEAKIIAQEFSDYVAGKSAAPWITDRSAFELRFKGIPKPERYSDKKEYDFGWWLRLVAQRAEITNYGSPFALIVVNDGAMPNFMTEDELRSLWKKALYLRKQERPEPHSSIVMDLWAFEFDGRDTEGQLFNMLDEVVSGLPTPKWFKRAKNLVEEIGQPVFYKNAARWLDHLTIPTVPPRKAAEIEFFIWLKRSLVGWAGEAIDTFPKFGTDAYRTRVLHIALEQAGRGWCANRFDDGKLKSPTENPRREHYYSKISDENQAVARGLVLILGHLGGQQSLVLLSNLLENLLIEDEYRECRSKKVISSLCWALGEIATSDAIALLGKARRHITDKGQLKQIDKALTYAGRRENLSIDDMKDRAMASHGIGADGTRIVEIEGWKAILRVVSTRKASLQTIAPNGKVSRGISKAFLALPGATEAAQSLQDSAEDIERILPEARRRFEDSFRKQRSWTLKFWQEHIAGNGLLRTMVSRLIWNFHDEAGNIQTAIVTAEGLVSSAGDKIILNSKFSSVTLWHPIYATDKESWDWQKFVAVHKIRQPFLQAWRPVYVLTDAERNTSTYSNRFAAHVLEQAPAMAILKAKGWNAVNRTVFGNKETNERVSLALPAFGLAAEFWVRGIGDVMQNINHVRESTLYAFVSTDRIMFYPLTEGKQTDDAQALTIENVPAIALSEAMFDIDSIINRTSIGNDRHWQDRGANAGRPLSEVVHFVNYRDAYTAGRSPEMAKARHAFLQDVLPGLEIANNCTLHQDHLLVDGKYNSYKINLISGNITIAPQGRYVCIVPKSMSKEDFLLPCEEDAILSVIISKAFYLSDEDKINDASVRSQLVPK